MRKTRDGGGGKKKGKVIRHKHRQHIFSEGQYSHQKCSENSLFCCSFKAHRHHHW
jgi:hypothetical protein